MRLRRWQVEIAATLIVAAIVVYALRWILYPSESFDDEMLRYLVDDIAFLFIQVLLVSMLLDGLMQRRQAADDARQAQHDHRGVLQRVRHRCPGAHRQTRDRELDGRWRGPAGAHGVEGEGLRSRQKQAFRAHEPVIELSSADLVALRDRLGQEKTYLLSLLGNQALLEHQTSTDLLWAVTHLAEELRARGDFDHLPPADRAHLIADVKRAYTLLGVQWIDYLQHLQTQYPFLFSLAVRTNPLDPRPA